MIKKLTLLSLVLANSIASAAEWTVDGDLHPSFKFDDNELMREKKQEDFSLSLRPTIQLARNTELAKSQLEFGYDVKRYDKLSKLERQDPFARFSTDFQGERSSYGLSMAYSERESRSFADEDTGNFSNTDTVTTKSISPTYSYRLTELDSISTGLLYTETSREATDGTDTDSISANVAWQRQFSERLSAGLSFVYVNTQSDSLTLSNEYDSYALSITSSYAYSELWALSGSLGMRYLDSTLEPVIGPSSDDTSQGETYSFSATRTDELSTLSLSASLALSPTSTGTVNEQNFYTASYTRNLSERLKASLYASYREFSSPDNDNNKTKYTEFLPKLSWNIDEKLSVDIAYRYRKNESDNNGRIESNSVFTSLNYNWDGIRLSR